MSTSAILLAALISSNPSNPAVKRDRPPDASAVLRRALLAESRVPFEGHQTIVISTGDSTDATETHEIILGNGLSRTEYLLPRSSAGRVVTEDGKTRWEYDPVQSTVVRSSLSNRSRSTGSVDRILALINKNYRLRLDAHHERGSGRPNFSLEITPRQNDRNRFRWWIDRATGHVFRREAYDCNGKLNWTSAYSIINYNPNRTTKSIAFHPPKNARIVAKRDQRTLTDRNEIQSLVREWGQIGQTLGRGFALQSACQVNAKGMPGLHLQYSDGIVAISLIKVIGSAVVPGEGQAARSVTIGGANGTITHESRFTLVSWGGSGRTLSMVGDVPENTLLAIARTVR